MDWRPVIVTGKHCVGGTTGDCEQSLDNIGISTYNIRNFADIGKNGVSQEMEFRLAKRRRFMKKRL
ncbi:MAG: hypothetical protein LBR77_03070, partial [Lachnospiraceae bacterium]|nr:hypothetical protein [Lachnospiraceae bacterium]